MLARLWRSTSNLSAQILFRSRSFHKPASLLVGLEKYKHIPNNNDSTSFSAESYAKAKEITSKNSRKIQQNNFKPVSGPPLWYGSQFSTEESKKLWQYPLTGADIAEIDNALEELEKLQVEIVRVTKELFPLPNLSKKLEQIQNVLLDGAGFFVIKGLPVYRYTRRQAAIAYWGIGTYMGVPVPQNKAGHLLGHVKDIGMDPKDPITRIYTTSARQPYHTDFSDIVGLLCLRTAKSGGTSSIASSYAVYNELLKLDPNHVRLLSEPMYYDRKGEIPEGKGPYFKIAVFHLNEKGELFTHHSPDYIWSAQKRFPDIPRLTEEQKNALNTLQKVPRENSVALDMELEPGDIQWLNNHTILHSRTAYEDHQDYDKRRHLLRLWLSTLNGKELPKTFQDGYTTIELGKPRMGIYVPGATLCAPLEASL